MLKSYQRGIAAMIKIHLSRILGERRWSQAYVARQTGIRPNTIGEIYGEAIARINVDHLDKICELLGCTISDLLEYVPNKYPTTGDNRIIEEHGNRKNK